MKKIFIKIENFYYFIFPIIYILIYSHLIFGNYLFHDMWDYFGYRFLQDKNCFDFKNYPLFEWFAFALGRFFGYVVLCLQVEIISSPLNSYLARLVTVLGVLIFYFLNSYILYLVTKNKNFSFIFSILVISLPGFLFVISWIGTGFIIFSWILSLLSFLFFIKYLKHYGSIKYIYLLLFSLFSIFSFLFYQMGPLYNFLLVTVFLIFNNKKEILNFENLKIILINIIQLGLLFIFFKFLFFDYLAKMDISRGSFFQDFFSNIAWFLNTASPRAFDLHFIKPSDNWSIFNILLLFILTFSIVKLTLFYKGLFNRVSAFFVIIFSFIILNLPLLISSYGVETYRVLINFSSFIICIVLITIFKFFENAKYFLKFQNIILIFVVIINFLNSNFLYKKVVKPRVQEIKFYKIETQKIINSGNKKVHFDNSIFLRPEKSIWRTDEIGIPNSAFFYHIPDMINFYLSKKGENYKDFEIKQVDNFKNIPDDVYKLDLNKLIKFANIKIE